MEKNSLRENWLRLLSGMSDKIITIFDINIFNICLRIEIHVILFKVQVKLFSIQIKNNTIHINNNL